MDKGNSPLLNNRPIPTQAMAVTPHINNKPNDAPPAKTNDTYPPRLYLEEYSDMIVAVVGKIPPNPNPKNKRQKHKEPTALGPVTDF